MYVTLSCLPFSSPFDTKQVNPYTTTVSLQYEKQVVSHQTTSGGGVGAGRGGMGLGLGPGLGPGQEQGLGQGPGPGQQGSGQGGLDILAYDTDATEDYLAAIYGKLRVLCMLQVAIYTPRFINITHQYTLSTRTH